MGPLVGGHRTMLRLHRDLLADMQPNCEFAIPILILQFSDRIAILQLKIFLRSRVKGNFDGEAFYEALNSQRLARRLTWKDVADQSGISASTLTRMAQGKRPDVDELAALLKWSSLKAEDFIEKPDGGTAEPLARMTAIIRTDARLSATNKRTLEGVLQCDIRGTTLKIVGTLCQPTRDGDICDGRPLS